MLKARAPHHVLQYVKTKRTEMAFETVTVPNVFSTSSKIRGRVEILANQDKPNTCTHILEALIDFSDVWVVGMDAESCALASTAHCPSTLQCDTTHPRTGLRGSVFRVGINAFNAGIGSGERWGCE
jgi:hypothetical protein